MKRALFWALLILGIGAVAYALPPATNAWSVAVTCVPNAGFNPDAGLGLVSCGTGYASINAETELTSPIYFAWRGSTDGGAGGKAAPTNLTKANYTTLGKKRCVGCNNGSSYQAEVTNANNSLFCIVTSANDAGVVITVECAK